MSQLQQMNEVLASFNLDAKCINAHSHRHFEFYDLKLGYGLKLSKLSSLSEEIALAIRSKTKPILDPIFDQGIVRLKVARKEADVLPFNTFLKNTKPPAGTLLFLFGETDDGSPLWIDMADNPHMLVAGGTGSGKSTFLHLIIANSLHRKDVKLFISDPKSGVEFSAYNDHVSKIVYNYNDTLSMLMFLEMEMNVRYNLMKSKGVSNAKDIGLTKQIVIIDEIADLMLVDKDRNNENKGLLEKTLCSLAQKARAAGIFLVCATQRPSVDVITGVIKANFPARLACRVSSAVDSKVILDRDGAEALLGKGDAIFTNVKHDFTRFQIAYATPQSIIGR